MGRVKYQNLKKEWLLAWKICKQSVFYYGIIDFLLLYFRFSDTVLSIFYYGIIDFLLQYV